MKPNFLTRETVLDIDIQDRKFDSFKVGDTIEVSQRVKEGEKERIQIFKGDVIAIKNKGISSTFVVRHLASDNVGVERIFPYHSPMINEVKIVKKGNVRRAKLYYIRDRVGKMAKIKEKVVTKEQKLAEKEKRSSVSANE